MSQLFIDPSLKSTGLALWNQNNGSVFPSEVGLVTSPGNKSWMVRALTQTKNILLWLENREMPSIIYCEYPQFYGTGRGYASASSGSLIKLTFTVGCIVQTFKWLGIPAVLITPNEWKGQLPKKVIIHRIQNILGKRHCKNFKLDIWDAVGIGLYKRGKL